MSTATSVGKLHTDELLDPISPEQPAGTDMRWTPGWDRIREARRSDDDLEAGQWAKRDRKAADWRIVQELATEMLRDSSKDLQLALWLTEANIKLQGFRGLSDGLHLATELMVRYWDKGLYPTMEDDPQDRAGPFEWLNFKLVDSIVAIPITVRDDQGRDYTFIDLQDARRVGSEAGCKTKEGDFDTKKKRAYDQALTEGHISLEMFDVAVKATRRSGYEQLAADFQQTYDEFKALEKVIDEKFGDAAPNLGACRTALSEIRQAVADILAQKRREEPDPTPVVPQTSETDSIGQLQTPDGRAQTLSPVSLGIGKGGQPALGASWQDAESLIRSGHVDKGLQEMTRLAMLETTGRDRFHRKLLLAEVCLASKRDRLARSILEELAEHIDKFQLEAWESSDLISSVWTQLYKLYKRAGDSSDADRADKLYQRLCRLDPWQALGCNE
ncbi:MAG TPA: type VI secretion system protein TssA [Terriglobia bacterium]|nr:type VI secretion system protein TssA [Terriglobia bacterium]